jgi:hypothetical protein
MRRVLGTILAVALLLGLGALAALALPNANASLAGAPAVSAAAPEFNPDAPAATVKYNMIGLPLNSTNQFTSAGYSYNADGLGKIVGTGVTQVLSWNPSTQTYLTWDVGIQDGTNFSLTTSNAYWILLDSTAGSVVSFVGDVPAQGSTHFTLTRPASAGCLLNDITLPLDWSSVANADQLATAVGNVSQVLQWNASTQTFVTWDVAIQDGTNFATKIGYPYRLCLSTGGATTWP